MEPADYAFFIAYKAWLESDAHFSRTLNANPGAFNEEWLRTIGRVFIVNRTIPRGQENITINAVVNSGQGNEMNLMERAARLSINMELYNASAVSAISKYSWFIWPQRWTMFDKLARISVLGTAAGNVKKQFPRFYVALAVRGWDEQLRGIRGVLRDQGMEPLLAERTLDKFLMLNGMSNNSRDYIASSIDTFNSLLPTCLYEKIENTSEQISEVLQRGRLLHEDSRESRVLLDTGMEQFVILRRGIT